MFVLWLISVAAVEGLILSGAHTDAQALEADCVFVLGGGIKGDQPTETLRNRLAVALDVMEQNPDVQIIVCGGQGDDEPTAEAYSMYEELVALGIDPSRVWIENRATSTWENLHFSLDLIEERTGKRPEKIGVLSSEYHLYRASLFAKACGVEFVGVPAKTSRVTQKINHFMREVAGVWHYWLLGGQYGP